LGSGLDPHHCIVHSGHHVGSIGMDQSAKSITKLLIFFRHWLRVGADVGVGREDCTTSTQDKLI
ncbi:unnamed protein product, partial [Ectocarpus sp. 12 AP-2014]